MIYYLLLFSTLFIQLLTMDSAHSQKVTDIKHIEFSAAKFISFSNTVYRLTPSPFNEHPDFYLSKKDLNKYKKKMHV